MSNTSRRTMEHWLSVFRTRQPKAGIHDTQDLIAKMAIVIPAPGKAELQDRVQSFRDNRQTMSIEEAGRKASDLLSMLTVDTTGGRKRHLLTVRNTRGQVVESIPVTARDKVAWTKARERAVRAGFLPHEAHLGVCRRSSVS